MSETQTEENYMVVKDEPSLQIEHKIETRGRKKGSYKYEIPGKGKVNIAEYKKWKMNQPIEVLTTPVNNN